MRFSAWIPAGEFERFAPSAWDGQVGHATRLEVFGTPVGWATVVSAKVASDGSGAELTFDVELEGQR